MEYLLIAFTLLFLPGLAITYLLNIDRYGYLISFSLSYALFVMLLQSMRFIGLDAEAFKYIYFLIVSILVLLAIIKYYFVVYIRGNMYVVKCLGCVGFAPWAVVLIIFSAAVYFYKVGAYLELPSDIFQHLEYMQTMTANILRSQETGNPVLSFLGMNGKYWHYLYSFIVIWSGTSIDEAIPYTSFFNVTVFLLAVFCFAQVVFKDMQSSQKMLVYTSLATVVFTFFHFGINIFSFIRYYALAPVILNLVLYFSIMAIVIDFYRDKAWNIKYLVVSGILFYAALYIHRQEALFAILMICIMSVYLFVQKYMSVFKLIWQGETKSLQFSFIKFFTDKVNISFLLSQAVMIALFVYSYLNMKRNQIDEPKIIPLENIIPFFKNLYILNPTYQFYYVVTLWGAAVILLFVLNTGKFKNNAFIMAGMLSPFFTVFNPFFTDMLLRHTYSLMLWRISFLVPIHLVAAYLFISAVQYIWTGSNLKKVYGISSIILLVVLLFPFKTTFVENTYSRMLTLKPVPAENSPEHWGDLIGYLKGIEEKKRIITDPVTGYMITALTDHVSPRSKFHRAWGGFIKFNYEDYSSNPFDRYKGYLFIINKRNGGISDTGRIARHWSEDILKIENYYYSENMEDYIHSNPDRFQLLWEKDNVRVYQIDMPKK